MYKRISLGTVSVLFVLAGCSSKRDLGNIPDGGGGVAGSAGASGSGGDGTGVAGTGGSGTGGTGGMETGGAGTGGMGTGGAGTGGTGTGGMGTGGAGTGGTGTAGTGGTGGCDPSHPFRTPVLVDGLNRTTGNDQGARLSPDELSVYFHSDRGGGAADLYFATRPSRSAAFANVTALASVNDPSTDAWPTVTGDGLSLFFETQRPTPQVWVATRTSVQGAFSGAAPVANIGATGAQPYVLPDGSALYLSMSSDIYRAARGVSGAFEPPVAVSTVNTPSTEFVPTVTPDELTLYHASDRTDAPAKGAFDIWMAKRASRAVPFGPPVNVQELNTAEEEVPTWISPDNCRLYFGRGGSSGLKILVAERS